MKKKILSAVIVYLSFAGFAHAAGNADAGQQKAVQCAGCHGADGSTPNLPNAPKLAGQHAGYLANQLAAFKSDARKDPSMKPMTASLTEQDMADLAAFYAVQKATYSTISEAEKIAGQSMYRGGNSQSGVAACIACHGPSGNGIAASNYPAISGQSAAYIEKALNDFKSEADASPARVSSYGGMMNGVASKMTAKEIKAIAKYVSALH
jgi:cytochrome c553